MGEQASPTDMAQLKQLIKDKENFKKQGSTEFKQIGEKIRSNAGLHDKSGAMKEAFDGLKEAYNNNPTAIADALKKM
jgi:ribosomal protein L32E